jgi:hypothetical protein
VNAPANTIPRFHDGDTRAGRLQFARRNQAGQPGTGH